MATREEKVSHKQMRLLRLRYDDLNTSQTSLTLKKDMEAYISSLRTIVERALKNSGFEKRPVYVDRTKKRTLTADEIANKGNVFRR